MAAEELSAAGCDVRVFDAKPSVARKLLMAGKSGLNLTKDEPLDAFLSAYGEAADWLAPMIAAFGPEHMQDWARGLGQDLFTGSTGRVFPKVMKGSPLLRAWLARLATSGVQVETRWRWEGWQGQSLSFTTPTGRQTVAADVTVLALGGASWARLGSDGTWTAHLEQAGVELAAFEPANAALRVDWSDHMARWFGAPLKGMAFSAGGIVSRGEAILSARGVEGGGVYPLTPALRGGAALMVDLLPDLTAKEVQKRLSRPRGKASLTNHLRKALGLSGVKAAMLQEMARPLPSNSAALAKVIKALPMRYSGLAPMDEAISTAGGVPWSALTDDLTLRVRPGVFCAGEMLDWEAPTGGYLLTACLATGRWAGRAAAAHPV